jgi:membrane-associated protease RseP (regulator of RpoE activity)
VRPPALPSPWKGSLKHFSLFALTAISIYEVGRQGWEFAPLDAIRLMTAVLIIMLAHEMGHYVACRIHRVDASLPYFIPFPSLVGTMGAFIRIRDPFPNRKILFDIGIAGPFAGFAMCLPVLALGILEAHFSAERPGPQGLYFGAPPLFEWALQLMKGPVPEGMTVVIGPLGVAAWFGLLLTALNMMPIGQLDGGHVTYSVLRERALYIGRAGLAVALFLVYLRPTWILWTVLLFVLARRQHPPTLDDAAPLGRTRTWLAVVGVAVFAVCFTPSPLVVSWSDFLHGLREIGVSLASWLTSR